MDNGNDKTEATLGTSTFENGSAPLLAAGPITRNIDWLTFLLTTGTILIVYLTTLAPEVTLEFSGLNSTSAAYAGVGQPPGFPVWSAYSWLFTKVLPLSNIAWRVACGGAVAAGVACGLVALVVSAVGSRLFSSGTQGAVPRSAEDILLQTVCGFVAGMTLGLSRPLWRMTVMAETWPVTAMLFAIVVFLFTCWLINRVQRRFAFGGFYLFGLLLTGNQEFIVCMPALLTILLLGDAKLGRDLSLPVSLLTIAVWLQGKFALIAHNTWLALGMLPIVVACLVAIYKTRKYGSEWRAAAVCIGLMLLGLGAYFYLPIVSMTTPPVNWAYARTVDGFFHLVTRGQYEEPHPTEHLEELLSQLWLIGKLTSNGFGWPYLVICVLPVLSFHRFTAWGQRWFVALVALFLCTGPLMVGFLNPTADLATTQLIQSYFIALTLVLAIWFGISLSILGGWLLNRQRKNNP